MWWIQSNTTVPPRASLNDERKSSLAVIVPVLNEAKTAAQLALRLSQLCAHEILVIDGGSSDQTVRLLSDTRPWPRLHAHAQAGGYRLLLAPRGRATQMNHGAEHSRADVLLFLHADTRLLPEQATAVQEAVAGGADFGCFTLRIDSIDRRLQLAAQLISLRSRLMPSATGDQAIFIRRSLFTQLGGFRQLELCEDLDLIGRARRRGRYTCIDRPVETSGRRWEQNGVVRTILLMWLLRLSWRAGLDPTALKRFYEDVR